MWNMPMRQSKATFSARVHSALRALSLLVAAIGCAVSAGVHAQDRTYDDKLGAGDLVKIQVYQNADLSLEARIQENGNISYPLLGTVHLAGLTVSEAEQTLASALKSGGFFQKPQVIVTQTQARKKLVAALGAIAKPGQYTLDFVDTRLSDVLAAAGGVAPTGADTVVVTGLRDGKPKRFEINLPTAYRDGKSDKDLLLAPGDVIFVDRAPVFYVYGEAQHPGAFRLDTDMTFMQALVVAGGPTPRGTERGLQVRRTGANGKIVESAPDMAAKVQPNDVIYVRESLF